MWISEEVRAILSPFPIYFNNIDLTNWVFPKQDKGRGLLDREITMITIPGRPGGVITGKRTPARFISQEVLIACESAEELRKKLEELNGILHTEKSEPLKFGDELDRTYYAMYAGAQEGYEIDGFYTATINFLCSDPYKYADPETLTFVEGSVVVQNNGTVEAAPTIRATVLEDITYMDVFNDIGYMRIGWPVESGEVKFNPKTKLLNEQFATITGWTAAGTTVDGGTVTGLIESNGTQFLANNFGTPAGATWHGPSLKKSVTGAPVQDFEVEWNITFTNPSPGTRGRMELYLRDDQSNVIGKVAMKRVGGGAGGNTVEIRIGSATAFHFYVNYAGSKGIEWKDFRGILRLSRKDNVWQAYVALVNQTTGVHTARYNPKPFVDASRLYMQALTQIQVHIAKDDTSPASYMRMNHLDVYRLNTEPTKVPVIAVEGDLIELDFKTSLIAINGEPRPDLKDFGATFFKLPKGITALLVEPFESLTTEIEIKEAFM
ncbi:distal tail protein Dit [Paenisporosarcina sp. OV554]|uniref:distal tail protein Dit n=1 Tax=Paenisporosarcina sp. OV554 TaxID=2135694 RepID=UPI000D39F173|nr:distal tail protein Dit [Paenisporosarcina sp. OV554]PUB12629.1 putative phage tail component-like protein [Paenisporosarcina sp. OV554]